MTRSSALSDLRSALAAELDVVCEVAGFRRQDRSVNYTRRIDGGRQRICFDLMLHPKYAPTGMHITAYFDVSWATVLSALHDMLPASDRTYFPAVLRVPIEQLVPFTGGAWIVEESEGAASIIHRLQEPFRRTVLPLARQLETPSGLVNWVLSQRAGQEIVSDVGWLAVAAVNVADGSVDQARIAISHMSANPARMEAATAFLARLNDERPE